MFDKNILRNRSNFPWIIAFAFILLGIFLRLYKFGVIPYGLQGDEASIGYETFSLLKTGKDRWGYSWPVYFISWISGQNTLYAYLSMPFVWLMGPSDTSIRMLSMLLSFGMIPLIYLLIHRIFEDKFLAIFTAIFVMYEPWQFMQSRWAFEGNIMPFLIILALYMLVKGMQTSEKAYLEKSDVWSIRLSFICFTFLLYCSAISLFFLPIFFAFLLVFFFQVFKKRPALFLQAFGLFVLVSIPFGLFILKNNILKHDLPFERFLPFSLPKMLAAREELPAGIGALINNFKINWDFIKSGFNDKFDYNILPSNVSHFVLIFAPVGLLFSLFDANKYAKLLGLWAISCCILFFLFFVNLNRTASLQLMLSILIAYGVYSVIRDLSSYRKWLVILLVVGVTAFSARRFYYSYFKMFPQMQPSVYQGGLSEAVAALEKYKKEGEKVAVTGDIVFNYLYMLYYTKFDPATFHQSNWVHAPNKVEVYSWGDYYSLGRMFVTETPYEENRAMFANESSFISIQRIDNEYFKERKQEVLYQTDRWKVVRYF